MTVAITGGSGHIGANLVRALLDAGRKVRALVYEDSRALEGLAVERVRGDLRDAASIEQAFSGAEVVYHLAARISVAGDDGGQVSAINLEGTRNVLKACKRAGVRRLIHFSSIHALSPIPGDAPIDETRPLYDDPNALAYEKSKAAGEREVLAAVAAGLDAVIVNPSAVLGPYDYKPSAMGTILLDLYHRRLPALVDGGFDWVDVRDVVAGAMAAEERGKKGERYLLTGHWRSVRDLADTVEKVTAQKAPRFVSPMWLARFGAPFAVAFARVTGKKPLFTGEALKALRHWRDIRHDKAARELGYTSRPLEETIAEAFRWYAQAGFVPSVPRA